MQKTQTLNLGEKYPDGEYYLFKHLKAQNSNAFPVHRCNHLKHFLWDAHDDQDRWYYFFKCNQCGMIAEGQAGLMHNYEWLPCYPMMFTWKIEDKKKIDYYIPHYPLPGSVYHDKKSIR
ncbi:MAG: hypothetical protein ACFFCI_00610 [Promethearchaeota archaeon]